MKYDLKPRSLGTQWPRQSYPPSMARSCFLADFEVKEPSNFHYELRLGSLPEMGLLLGAFGLQGVINLLKSSSKKGGNNAIKSMVMEEITGKNREEALESCSAECKEKASDIPRTKKCMQACAKKWGSDGDISLHHIEAEIGNETQTTSPLKSWLSQSVGKRLREQFAGERCGLKDGIETIGIGLINALTDWGDTSLKKYVEKKSGYFTKTVLEKGKKLAQEQSLVHLNVWMGNRLDLSVTHAADEGVCKKILKPKLKAYFQTDLDFKIFHGHFETAFEVFIQFPLTPFVADLGDGPLNYCGVLGDQR